MPDIFLGSTHPSYCLFYRDIITRGDIYGFTLLFNENVIKVNKVSRLDNQPILEVPFSLVLDICIQAMMPGTYFSS